MRIPHGPESTRPPAASRLLVPFLLVLVAACSDGGRNGSTPAQLPPSAAAVSAERAEVKAGNVTFLAVVIQTSQIPAEVAAEHGIEQRDDLVMLRVSPRQGEPGNISSPAAVKVTGSATDLSGRTSVLEFKRKVVSGLVDYVATKEISLPANMRFEITVTAPQGESKTMLFSHKFMAR